MKLHPKPSNVSVAVVDKALRGEIDRDELLSYVAELERRASFYGRNYEYMPALARILSRTHSGFSEWSSVGTVYSQVAGDLEELGLYKERIKKAKLLEPFISHESAKKLLRDITA
jgi:hypothetical protein